MADFEEWRFEPQPDITAYELAQILAKVSGFGGLSAPLHVSPDKPIPEPLRRHFKKL